MASVPLGSCLKRYKLGTAKVVNWLSSTARKVSRSSGEGIKLGKKLTTKDLVRLAEFITNAKPTVSVPAAILTATADVIKGRTFCADFFQQLEGREQSSKNILEVNKSHRHFMSVLEEVQLHLRSLSIAKSGSAEKQTGGSSTSGGKRNLFDILQLEEPDETSAEAATSSSLTSAPTSVGVPDSPDGDPLPTFEEDEEDAAAFAIWCAFQDIHEIRIHLQGVWRRYYDGNISFLVASHTTEAAFKFLVDIDIETLGEHYPWTYDGYQGISDFLGFESSSTSGKPTYFMNRLSKATPNHKRDRIVPPTELFCVHAWMVLQDFRLVCGAHRDWQSGVYPHIRWSSHPLATILRNAESTIQYMADQDGVASRWCIFEGFHTDCFTQGLAIVSNIGEVPIWLVAQCQILMDIFDALGMQADIGHNVLHETMQRENDPMARKMKMMSMPGMEMTPAMKKVHAKFSALREELEVTTRSEAQPEQLTGSYPWPTDRQPEQLLTTFPLLAGYRLRSIVLGKCVGAIDSANTDICVLGAAYLYRAAKHSGLLSGEWADMEALIRTQNMHGTYVRSATTLEGYARHFDIAIGVSATAFSGNRPRRPSPPSASAIASKMKKLEIPSSFILSMVEICNEARTSDGEYACMLRTAQRVYDGRAKPGMRKNFTPLELVTALEQSLMEDEALVKFNYMGFWARCRALLNAICYGSGDMTDKLLNSDGRKVEGFDNSSAAELVHAALWEVADLEKSKQGWRGKLNTTLAEFAHYMRNMILLDNDPHLSVARAGSSGYIEEKYKPCNLWKWGGELPLEDKDDSELSADDVSEKVKVDSILNAACAKYRGWENQDWTTEQRMKKTRLWTDKEFKKGGHDIQVQDIDIIPEYGQIAISIKSATRKHAVEGMQRVFERMMTGGVLEELPDLLPCV